MTLASHTRIRGAWNHSEGGKLIVYSRSTARAALEAARHTEAAALILETDARVPKREDLEPRVQVRDFRDYLSDKDFQRINERSGMVLADWYADGGSDLSSWNSVSLGRAHTGYRMLHQFISMYTNALCLRRILETENLKEALLAAGVSFELSVWSQTLGDANIPCTTIGEDRKHNETVRSASLRNKPRKVWQRARDSLRRLRRACSLQATVDHGGCQANPVVYSVASKLIWRAPEKWKQLTNNPEFRVKNRELKRVGLFEQLQKSAAIRNAKEIMASRWPRLADRLKVKLHFEDDHIDLWPHTEAWLKSEFTKKLVRMAGAVSLAQSCLATERPAALLIEAELESEVTAWALVAQKLGIPVIGVQPELLRWEVHQHFLSPVCDWVLSSGEGSAKWFHKKGFDDQKVRVIRAFRRDRIRAATKKPTSQSRRRSLLYADSRWSSLNSKVLFLDYRDALETVLNAAERMPEIDVWIKFHPAICESEGPDAIDQRSEVVEARRLANVHIVPIRSDLQEVLNSVDIVVSFLSTVGLEAMLAGKPVVGLEVRQLSWDFFSAGTALVASDPESLVNCIKKCTDNPKLCQTQIELQHRYLASIWAENGDIVTAVKACLRPESGLDQALTSAHSRGD